MDQATRPRARSSFEGAVCTPFLRTASNNQVPKKLGFFGFRTAPVHSVFVFKLFSRSTADAFHGSSQGFKCQAIFAIIFVFFLWSTVRR